MPPLRRLVLPVVLTVLIPTSLLSYDVPKDLVIKRPEKNAPMASWVGEVQFPHGKHAVLNACRSCHHEESDRTLGEFLKCSQCHNKPGEEAATSFYLAWHNDSPHSCLGCHRQVRLNQRGTPPLSCTNGCHKKA
jgi:hypothetical protein